MNLNEGQDVIWSALMCPNDFGIIVSNDKHKSVCMRHSTCLFEGQSSETKALDETADASAIGMSR